MFSVGTFMLWFCINMVCRCSTLLNASSIKTFLSGVIYSMNHNKYGLVSYFYLLSLFEFLYTITNESVHWGYSENCVCWLQIRKNAAVDYIYFI